MKVALIGCGRMGLRHLEILQNLPISSLSLCDSNIENLGNTKSKVSGIACQVYTDTNFLDQIRPELVIIATTASSHYDLTNKACLNGAKWILCEKPMAVSLAQCKAMIDVCEQYKVHLSINHQMRFMEQYTKPKKMIEEGFFGELQSVSVKAGNFGLAMNGTHYFEMFRYMTNENIQDITGWLSDQPMPSPRGPHFFDQAGSVLARTKTGKRFYLDADKEQGHGVWVIYTCKNGQIFVDELNGLMYFSHRQKDFQNSPMNRYGEPSHNDTQKIKATDIIDATESVLRSLLAEKNYPSGIDGYQAVKCLVGAYTSNANNNKMVNLESDEINSETIYPWA